MNKTRKQSIGILDRGKGTKVIDSTFVNLDVGIQSEGEGLEATGNKHIDLRSKQEQNWHEKLWVRYILLPLLVLLVGAFLVFKLGWS
jgi:hypothetical protein